MAKYLSFLAFLLLLTACQEDENRSDAYGNFEATTVLVSAEASGQLLSFKVIEGQKLATGQLIGLVDTTLLHLQRKQIQATIGTLPSKLQNSLAEIEVLKGQKANLNRERDRIASLVANKAATPKQLDDLNGELEIVDKRIAAISANTRTANGAILSQKEPLLAQLELVNEQIRRAYCYNPVAGTVLTKMAEEGEMIGMGGPLYRIGRLDTMTLKAYAGSVALQQLALNKTVEVLVDEGSESYRQLSGVVSKISDQAEFTPKTIQTKEDRVNLVYAFEVKVPNPKGLLKIGMPAEVNFSASKLVNQE
jgi:HlyD family secretion protein